MGCCGFNAYKVSVFQNKYILEIWYPLSLSLIILYYALKFLLSVITKKKERRKERRNEGRKRGRRKGGREKRKEGEKKEGRKEGRKGGGRKKGNIYNVSMVQSKLDNRLDICVYT